MTILWLGCLDLAGWAGMAGIDWAELGWPGLAWAGLRWPEPSWAELGCGGLAALVGAELDWAVLGSLGWPRLGWAELR